MFSKMSKTRPRVTHQSPELKSVSMEPLALTKRVKYWMLQAGPWLLGKIRCSFYRNLGMNVLLLKHIRASQVDTWSLPHSPNSKYYGWFTPPIFPAEDWRAMEITAFPFGIQDNLWDHSDGVAWNWNWTHKYTWGLRTVGKFRGGNVLISVYFSACPLSWPRNESHLWALFSCCSHSYFLVHYSCRLLHFLVLCLPLD